MNNKQEKEINMQEKPTDELDEMLKNMKPAELDGYFSNNKKYLAEGEKAFYYYMKDVLEAKNILLKDVYSFSGVSESYGGKIITMEKHTKNRDLILRLCIAGHFSLDKINRALKLYGMNPLYAKDRRDAVIIVAVNNRKYDFGIIDEMLEKAGEKILSAEAE